MFIKLIPEKLMRTGANLAYSTEIDTHKKKRQLSQGGEGKKEEGRGETGYIRARPSQAPRTFYSFALWRARGGGVGTTAHLLGASLRTRLCVAGG
jgi:hypothetical protein